MFQFRRFPSYTYLIQYMMHDLHRADFSIRKSAGQSSLTAHRSLSQLTTSFIGSQCQGIHPALIFALPFAFSIGSLRDLYAIFWQLCSFLPDFKFTVSCLFDVVVLAAFTLQTRSFLIFALHLLFSFQDAFDIDCSAINISGVLQAKLPLSNFLLVLFLSEQISEENFFSSQICFEG